MPAAEATAAAGAALARVTAALPGGEPRPGQVAMAEAVAEAIELGRHLVVQAGTGTGKSLAYLVPALLSGRRAVVATATKALQEQLVAKDIPFLAEHLGVPFRAALLKGRSNYLCRASLADAADAASRPALPGTDLAADRLREVLEWSAVTATGDRADLPIALAPREWSAVSVGVGECPGRLRCPHGDTCFAEQARDEAAEADLVVVNTHLYGLHLATGGAVLPEHDVVVIDEAHALEDVVADTLGANVGPGRLDHLARSCRGLFTGDHEAVTSLQTAGVRLGAVLEGLSGQRVEPAAGDLGQVLLGCAEAVAAAAAAARGLDVGGDAGSRRERILQLATHLVGDLRRLAEPDDERVAWVEAGAVPALRLAPVDVGAELSTRLLGETTVILTSATLAVGGSFEPVARRLGLDRAGSPMHAATRPGDEQEPDESPSGDLDGTGATGPAGEPEPSWRGLDVGSPFDYEHQALLYCAAHLPDPRAAAFEPAMLEELEELVLAAGGRTLALFTSRRAMEAAAEHLAPRIPFQLLVQDARPRPLLLHDFLDDESSVLLATMGFWQGFDAPGATCSLVVIDRLPFARPDDPLREARREAATRARQNAFAAVDLPHAAVLLAQGAGRLIRRRDDRGVVAVLDRRLATASYRWTLVKSLPPMRRTRDGAEARRVLAELAGVPAAG